MSSVQVKARPFFPPGDDELDPDQNQIVGYVRIPSSVSLEARIGRLGGDGKQVNGRTSYEEPRQPDGNMRLCRRV